MDAYLGNTEMWPEVHSQLIVAIADALAPFLHPKYYAAIEKRTYLDTPEDSILIGIPDVSVASKGNLSQRKSQPEIVTLPLPEEVIERYLEIRETDSTAVITAIEILLPKNKRAGEGRTAYLTKRQRILASQTHLIEIDLLRGQNPMPVKSQSQTDYRILVSRSDTRPKAELYGFDVQKIIPIFAVPLKSGDVEPKISLKAILDDIYDRAGFSFRVNYHSDIKPPLSPEDEQWALGITQ
jgi:hypothetical protein